MLSYRAGWKTPTGKIRRPFSRWKSLKLTCIPRQPTQCLRCYRTSRGRRYSPRIPETLWALVPLHPYRRLRRKSGQLTIHRLEDGVLSEDEIRKVNYHIRSNRGSILFARCWLLVEGEADRLILEGCTEALERDLSYEGVSFLEYQQSGVGVEVLIKFADAMGIDWFLVADCDDAGNKYVAAAKRQLGTRAEQEHIGQLQHGDLELFLCMEGYGHSYEQYVAPNKWSNISAAAGTPSLAGNK